MASAYDRTLIAISAVRHTTVEHANQVSSQRTVSRLINDGLVERDPEWTGCLRVTDAGYNYLDTITV